MSLLRLPLLGWVALTLVSVGCGSSGPPVNLVEGKVTMDGSPLAGATVMFSPTSSGTGRAAAGVTDASGVYKLTDMAATAAGSGAATGDYLVAITKSEGDGGGGTGEESGSDYEYNPNPNAPMTMKSAVPDKYTRPESSGLTATVAAGKNEINFDLSSN